MDQYSTYIATSRYCRWLPEHNRRETWDESVERYASYWRDKGLIDDSTYIKLYNSIQRLDVVPSMRALMSAGPALDRDNVAGFNCSYVAVDGNTREVSISITDLPELDGPITIGLSKPTDWDEAMYILMCGTGVGFSVERQYVNKLPTVGNKLSRKIYARTTENFPGVDKEELSTFSNRTNAIYVSDSKYGWASALRILVCELYNGNMDVGWDVSKVRPSGSPLKTFGGRASGPEPLEALFKFTKEVFSKAVGRKLNSLECHDIMCKVAEVVVVGGVRRSALISLSNLSDQRMARCKTGDFGLTDAQRYLANNSVAYTEKPDVVSFMAEWQNLIESRAGERGIVNRVAAQKQASKSGRRDGTKDFGTNPCGEIILRNKQFC